jgi:hypothetical protein
MPQRIRLLTSAQISNHVYGPGEVVALPDGVRGPHRSVSVGGVLHDEPLYVPVDEAMEKEREDMRLRHLAETEALDGTTERRELALKHAKESAELRHKQLVAETEARHKVEAETLQHRQEAEVAAFDKRAEVLTAANPPAETVKEDLEARHKAEAEALKVKQEGEQKALEPVPEAEASDDTADPAREDDSGILPMPSPVDATYPPPPRQDLPRQMPFPQPSNPV